jgi:hypothetical protein
MLHGSTAGVKHFCVPLARSVVGPSGLAGGLESLVTMVHIVDDSALPPYPVPAGNGSARPGVHQGIRLVWFVYATPHEPTQDSDK